MASAEPARESSVVPAVRAAAPVVGFGLYLVGVAVILGLAGFGVIPGVLVVAGGVLYGRAVAERGA